MKVSSCDSRSTITYDGGRDKQTAESCEVLNPPLSKLEIYELLKSFPKHQTGVYIVIVIFLKKYIVNPYHIFLKPKQIFLILTYIIQIWYVKNPNRLECNKLNNNNAINYNVFFYFLRVLKMIEHKKKWWN